MWRIIATLNEEKGIGPTLAELKEVLEDSTYLIVDGNSIDRTVEIAKEMGAEVVFQEGSGKGDAIAKAIKHVDSNVKYVVFIDADFTYPAKCVPEMIQILPIVHALLMSLIHLMQSLILQTFPHLLYCAQR